MNNQKSVLYDTDWQRLRISTLAQYHRLGGWSTPEGADENIQTFETYIYDAPDSKEQFYRAWRVLNMLNATRMGYSGQGLRGSEMDKKVEKFRDDVVQPLYQSLQNEGQEFSEWDWEREKNRINEMKKSDPLAIARIKKNLQSRHDTTMKRKKTVENRPELVKYLELLT